MACFRLAARSATVAYSGVLALTLAACSSIPTQAPSQPVAATITVVKRGWHTDICVRSTDAGPWLMALAQGYDGTRFLCFGYGERQYVVNRHHDPLTMLRALLPSQGALLLTMLSAPPAAAFSPPDQVLNLGISRAGLSGLQAYLRRSVQTDEHGTPIPLGTGPYLGSVFFAATGTYDLIHTCNTWTARALHAAGLPVSETVLFASGVMHQAQQFATPQAGDSP